VLVLKRGKPNAQWFFKHPFLAENTWNLTRCLMGVCIDWGEAALRETANVGEFSMFFLTLSQFIHL
jgi:hypothetical protein